MKKEASFIELHSKLIIRVLVLVWLFLIIKLWALWLSFSCGWWWFISLCIIPTPSYSWSIVWYLTIIIFIISIFILFKIKWTKDIIKKVQLAFLIFLIWIFSRQILFLISSDFKFYLTPMQNKYMDEDWNITDLDLYLELITKHCNNNKNNEVANCAWKMASTYDTPEDYMKVLDYAIEHSYRNLYSVAYNNFENEIWLENMIKRYHNVNFYANLIYIYYDSETELNLIKKNTDNKILLDLIDFVEITMKDPVKWYKWELSENMSDYNKNELYIKNFKRNLYKKMKEESTINTIIFK